MSLSLLFGTSSRDNKNRREGVFIRLSIALLTCLTVFCVPVAGHEIFAITTGNSLLRFESATPGTVSSIAITGLQAGEDILGIDFRPATGQLYALGSAQRLYTINTTTGVATLVGSAGAFTLAGTDFGFDFNPVPDRIRVTSDANQNLRLNPDDGTQTAADPFLAYAAADLNSGQDPNIVASAYTNSFAGSATTTLYDIDSNLDILVIQDPPNNGTLNTVGPLGVNTNGLTGFDILGNGSNTAFASLTAPGASSSGFYTINLNTGAATLIGIIGGGAAIRDIALNQPRADRAWSTAGSTGTLDEDSQTNAALNNFVVALAAGQTGTVTVRYNITAVRDVSSFCPAISSRIVTRFRDSDGPGTAQQVTFTIRRSSIALGGNVQLFAFDSNTALASVDTSFHTVIQAAPIDFDFGNNIYWIEVQVTRGNAAAFADLGSIHITEVAGTPCP